MLREYDCWLQQRKIKTDYIIPNIVVANEKGLVGRQAVKEYSSGIKRLLGFTPKIKKRYDTNQSTVILTSSIQTTTIVPSPQSLVPSPQTPDPHDGFIIKVTENKINIYGTNEEGLLYGVFRFLSLLAQNKIKAGLELTDAPASPLRIINHWDNLDGTIERGYAGGSLFYKNGDFNYNKKRITDYARLLASIGINRLSINNVNVRAEAKLLITEKYLKKIAKLAAIFRKFGIRLFISINFGAPWSLRTSGSEKLPTADPLDPAVATWWKKRARLIYKYIPDLAGFLVKADSEGEPGPFQYNRTHADGANMLAKALEPFNGTVIWRCFVYNCTQDWRDKQTDRARAAYDNFMPLDGQFADNVILQIKHGPIDFQVREPVTPLFFGLKKTRHIMELQITQEYTGHQIDLCYLPYMWEDLHRITRINANEEFFNGYAAVVNVGLDNNWTGHTLAQANLYGYGRIAWNPKITAQEIAEEWSSLSFGAGITAQKVTDILLRSYPAYEKYNAPFGIGFMVTPGTHYGPNIEGYEFSRWGTYHRADKDAIGIDRTVSGTGYLSQYPPEIAKMYADPKTCPENILLFFHRLRYDFVMKNGQTLLQNIYDTHFEGYEEVESMIKNWKSLKELLEPHVYESVLARFERQLTNAREWRDQINTYFYRKTGIKDAKGRKIF